MKELVINLNFLSFKISPIDLTYYTAETKVILMHKFTKNSMFLQPETKYIEKQLVTCNSFSQPETIHVSRSIAVK